MKAKLLMLEMQLLISFYPKSTQQSFLPYFSRRIFVDEKGVFSYIFFWFFSALYITCRSVYCVPWLRLSIIIHTQKEAYPKLD